MPLLESGTPAVAGYWIALAVAAEEVDDCGEESPGLLEPGKVSGAFKYLEPRIWNPCVQMFRDGDRTYPAMSADDDESFGADIVKLRSLIRCGRSIDLRLRMIRPGGKRSSHVALELCGIGLRIVQVQRQRFEEALSKPRIILRSRSSDIRNGFTVARVGRGSFEEGLDRFARVKTDELAGHQNEPAQR